MKKIILMAAAAVMMAVSANAQNWNKGDWFTGAQIDNLGLNVTSWDGGSTTTFGLNANVGYVFANKFAADVTAGIGFDSTKIDGVDDKDKSTTARFGVGVSYYPVKNLFARVGYELEADKDMNPANFVGVTVGYDIFVNDKLFFTPAVYYKNGLENDGWESTNNFGLKVGLGVKF